MGWATVCCSPPALLKLLTLTQILTPINRSLRRARGDAPEQEGFLITSSTAIQGEAQSRMATQWQGYTATVPATQSMLHLLPADGTVKCVDRLRNGSVGDCLHPDVSAQTLPAP